MIKGSANIKVYLVIGINKLGSRIIYKILISTSFVKQNYDEEHFSLTLSEWTLSYFLSGFTARKVSKYGVISGPYFPIFGLNTEIYGVFPRIQPYYRKIRPEITPYLATFHVVFATVDTGLYSLSIWITWW